MIKCDMITHDMIKSGIIKCGMYYIDGWLYGHTYQRGGDLM